MSLMPIDLDAEAILFEGQWSTRDDLARRIKAMLDGGDYSIARQSSALEQLTQTLASVRTLAFRATPDLVEALNMAAARSGKSVGGFIRDTLIDNIAGAPEVAQAHPSDAAAAPRAKTDPEMLAAALPIAGVAAAAPVPAAAAANPQFFAGPGALKAAGLPGSPKDVTMMGGSKDVTLVGTAPRDPGNVPSVVVEPDLANETAVELTNPKKKEEESERRWFNQ
jgi:predicted HicB family RNase H-like nuclease